MLVEQEEKETRAFPTPIHLDREMGNANQIGARSQVIGGELLIVSAVGSLGPGSPGIFDRNLAIWKFDTLFSPRASGVILAIRHGGVDLTQKLRFDTKNAI